MSSYELERQKNIEANRAILASLGLEKPLQKKTRAAPPAAKKNIKKRSFVVIDEDGGDGTPTPAPDGGESVVGTRRSARIRKATVRVQQQQSQLTSENDDNESTASDSDTYELSDDDTPRRSRPTKRPKHLHGEDSLPGLPRRLVNGRYVAHLDPTFSRPNPKHHGPPNVPVGTWWATRQECSLAGVHAPWVAGIAGSDRDGGAYSVALSGGYEDDVDEGFRFTFTGCGGRELKKKNLRTAPQSKDQVLQGGNAALVESCRSGNVIRVIRGYKGRNRWAPESGYRYDGLYQVVKWWKERGLAGFEVFKFAFKRVDGQVPIVLGGGGEGEYEEVKEEEEGEEGEKGKTVGVVVKVEEVDSQEEAAGLSQEDVDGLDKELDELEAESDAQEAAAEEDDEDAAKQLLDESAAL